MNGLLAYGRKLGSAIAFAVMGDGDAQSIAMGSVAVFRLRVIRVDGDCVGHPRSLLGAQSRTELLGLPACYERCRSMRGRPGAVEARRATVSTPEAAYIVMVLG
jgi:hypothetical protein